MQCTILKDFFADVSIWKCKAAKKVVMDKLLSGLKEEYTKVFDYQLELLRSNPGSLFGPNNYGTEHILEILCLI
jgi:hypothetical protein